MNCPKCKADVDPKSVYCPKCGERLNPADEDLLPGHRDSGGAPAKAPSSEGSPARVFEPLGGQRPPADGPGDAMARVNEQKESDASTLWEGRYSFKAIIPWMILTAAALIVAVFVGLHFGFGQWYWYGVTGIVVALFSYELLLYAWRHVGHRYRLTPQTFFHERGIIFRTTSPIEIVAIDDIAFDQTILERLFGVGTIRLLSKDMIEPALAIKGIPNVKDAFSKIDQARRAERRARAVRIDNV